MEIEHYLNSVKNKQKYLDFQILNFRMFSTNILLIFTFLSIITYGYSLKTTDLCLNTKKQCITNTKSKKIVCKDFKCEKRLNFDCKIGYCSIDKQSCESITGIIYSIELLEINNQIFRFNGESQKKQISSIDQINHDNASFFKWAIPGLFSFIFVFSIKLTVNKGSL